MITLVPAMITNQHHFRNSSFYGSLGLIHKGTERQIGLGPTDWHYDKLLYNHDEEDQLEYWGILEKKC